MELAFWVTMVLDLLHARARVRKLLSDNLNAQNTKRESVQLLGVNGWMKESVVEDLPSTEQVITHSLVDSTIGASSQEFSFEEFDCLVPDLSLGLFCHCRMKIMTSSRT